MSLLSNCLRPLNQSDLPRLIEIENEVQTYPWTSEIFLSFLSKNYQTAWGVEIEQKLIAYAFFAIESSRDASLLNISVAKKFWRKGVASCLLAFVIETVSQARVANLFLEASEDNKSAIFLYEKFGFTQVGVRPNYYCSKDGARGNAIIFAMEFCS